LFTEASIIFLASLRDIISTPYFYGIALGDLTCRQGASEKTFAGHDAIADNGFDIAFISAFLAQLNDFDFDGFSQKEP
jgi:hypothetical protein